MMKTIGLAAFLLALPLSACSDSGSVTPPPPVVGPQAAPRFQASVASALVDADLLASDAAPPDVKTSQVLFGAGQTPSPWHDTGFPVAGVKGEQHLVRYDLPDTDGGVVFAALLRIERPADADTCDAPWNNAPFAGRPCEQKSLGDGLNLVTVEFNNILEMYLVGPHATIGITSMRADEDGNLLKQVPLSQEDQQALLYDVAQELADSTTTAKA